MRNKRPMVGLTRVYVRRWRHNTREVVAIQRRHVDGHHVCTWMYQHILIVPVQKGRSEHN